MYLCKHIENKRISIFSREISQAWRLGKSFWKKSVERLKSGRESWMKKKKGSIMQRCHLYSKKNSTSRESAGTNARETWTSRSSKGWAKYLRICRKSGKRSWSQCNRPTVSARATAGSRTSWRSARNSYSNRERSFMNSSSKSKKSMKTWEIYRSRSRRFSFQYSIRATRTTTGSGRVKSSKESDTPFHTI